MISWPCVDRNYLDMNIELMLFDVVLLQLVSVGKREVVAVGTDEVVLGLRRIVDVLALLRLQTLRRVEGRNGVWGFGTGRRKTPTAPSAHDAANILY